MAGIELSDLGELVFSVSDAEGEIHVYQDRRFRYLTFGNAVEQSCLDLANPVRAEHVYTQAMLLGLLLHPEIRRVGLLGMGGGGLARALRAADRGLRIVGVERRAAVIGVARDYFDLPDDARFDVVHAEAEAFLRPPQAALDLIFSDLYLADRVYPGQASRDFLALCRERLSDHGVLISNHWASEFTANRSAFTALAGAFGERMLHLHVQGGNIIAFAFRDQLPDLRRDEFFAAAQSLGLRLGIPLQRHARSLWRQNAEILGVGRFRHGRRR